MASLKWPRLRARGVDFFQSPASYYANLKEQLKKSKVKIIEDLFFFVIQIKTIVQSKQPFPSRIEIFNCLKIKKYIKYFGL